MSYLDCAQYDCCHNKAGCCCLNDIKVHHTGESDAVCSSYRNSEGYGNVATDNQPASPETEIACDDSGCRHQQGHCCQPCQRGHLQLRPRLRYTGAKITANCAKRLPLWNGEAFLCAFSCETPHFVV